METSIGIAAGVALAAALPELPFACGLATLPQLGFDVVRDPLVPEHGVLQRRVVAPDAELLARYQEASS
jgi:O-succinylbenzoate synthase